MNVTAINNYPMPQARDGLKQVSDEESEEGGIEFLQSLGQAGEKSQPIAANLQGTNGTALAASQNMASAMMERMALQGKAQAAQAAASSGASSEQMLGIGDAAKTAQPSAVSMNTGVAIAGLQPWSRDWVFTQGDIQNPDQNQGIFSRGDATQTATLKKLAESIGASESQMPELERILSRMQGSVEGMSMAAPSSAPVSGEGAEAKPAQPKVMSGADYLGALGVSAAPNRAQAQSGGQMGQGMGGEAGGKPALKIIDGGRLKKAGPLEVSESTRPDFASMLAANPANDAGLGAARVMPQVTGHVVQGRMAQDRLSTEALLGITNNIAGISGNRMDASAGEIRVRLKPDNLGELHLRVRTDGNSVGLKIQASDARAQQILEESLPHLKDSLSAQNLKLGQVEVSVAHATQASSNSSADQSSNGQWNAQGQAFNDLNRNQQGGSQSNSRWERDGSAGDARVDRANWAQPASATASARRPQVSGGSRIDLHA